MTDEDANRPSVRPPGDVLSGGYRILHLLAAGGMGKTFVGEQLQPSRKVVIKTLRSEWAKKPGALERFRREAELASSVSHPNIVQVFDYAIDQGEMPFLVMEYIEGMTLSEWALRHNKLASLVQVIRPILSGLQVLHDVGIVHRDIKPSNIMLQNAATEDGLGIPKLIDFGLARIFDSEEMMRLTQTGQIMGTPGFLAPEQVTGMELDARTDLYAVAVVMYRILAGRFPFGGEDPASLIRGVVSEAIIPIDSICPELPEGFVEVLHQALEKVPDRRFQSALELADALAPFESGDANGASRQSGLPERERSSKAPGRPSDAPGTTRNAGRKGRRPRNRDARQPISLRTWGVMLLLGAAGAILTAVVVYRQLSASTSSNDPLGNQPADSASTAGSSSQAAEDEALPGVPAVPYPDGATRQVSPPPGEAAEDGGSEGDSTATRETRGGQPTSPTLPSETTKTTTSSRPRAPALGSLSMGSIRVESGEVSRSEVQRWANSVMDKFKVCMSRQHQNHSSRVTVTFGEDGKAIGLQTSSRARSCLRDALPGGRLRGGPAQVRFWLRWRVGDGK